MVLQEYLPAGDLFNLVHMRSDFTRDDAKRYAAELVSPSLHICSCF